MRVITGAAKGRKLETLSGQDVRPTVARIKEAVFSVIQFQVQGRVFLDLFAGSGQMGIEALSRGAKEAVFVDKRREAVSVIQKNLQTTKLDSLAKVVQTDAISFLTNTDKKFDLVFLDPPYEEGLLQEILPLVVKKMSPGGRIICESPQNEVLPEEIDEFVLDRTYHYGKIKANTYCHRDVTE